jgi:hypothetical protein
MDIDQHKTDVYSIGVTFIEMSTLKSSEDLYDYKIYESNITLLKARKYDMARNYSAFYCKVIDSMTDINPDLRCNCG